MARIAFIVPYFGKLPDTFRLWLRCCENNRECTWFIFTDDTAAYHYPDNVHVTYITLRAIRERFERKLGFSIALERPYKLCDFRPMFGHLFEEELRGYSHWGYCDADILFGRLDEFLRDDLLCRYEKINALGHLSVYKNTADVNRAYEQCDYRAVAQDPRNRVFDEVRFEPNINSAMKRIGMKVYTGLPYANIGDEHFNFHLREYVGGKRTKACAYMPTIFQYRDGRVFQYSAADGYIVKREIAYVHFQRRNMRCDGLTVKEYLMVPNRFIENEDVTMELIAGHFRDDAVYFIGHCCRRIQRAIVSRIRRR